MSDSIEKKITDRDELIKLLKVDVLEKMIAEIIGFKGINLNFEYNLLFCKYCPSIFSVECTNDLIEFCGIMKHSFSHCMIESTNSDVEKDENGNLKVWISMNFNYTMHSGGFNGVDFADFVFENGEWECRTTKERYS